MDGFELCRTIHRDSDIPIIMLTTRGEVMDRVVGLELGADDHLPTLLALLARVPGKVFGRDDILNHLRGHEAELYTRAVDIVVSRLRKKLEPLDCIKTPRNAGYTLVVGRVRAAPVPVAPSGALRAAAFLALEMGAGVSGAGAGDDSDLSGWHAARHRHRLAPGRGALAGRLCGPAGGWDWIAAQREAGQALTQRLPVSVRIDGPLVHWASNDPGHAEEWDHDRRYDGRPRLLERITADGHRVTLGLGDLPWKTLSLALVHLQHLGGLVMVDLDRVRLRLALRNLLDNGRWRNAAAQRGRPACLWRPEEHP